jgi:branched-chain amino acid aminotransferase
MNPSVVAMFLIPSCQSTEAAQNDYTRNGRGSGECLSFGRARPAERRDSTCSRAAASADLHRDRGVVRGIAPPRHEKRSGPGAYNGRQPTEEENAMGSESLVVYVNGEYVPREQARISIFDVGFLRGDAVFDTTSAWNGRIFKLAAHLERLERSMRAARIECPLSSKALADVVVETTRRCGLRNAYIQTIVTRGEPPFGIRDLTQCRAGLIVFAIPYAYILGPDRIQTGGRAMIVSPRALPAQCLDPKIKSLSRQHFDLAVLQGKSAGADVSLMLDLEGHVTEGPGFNVFVVQGGVMFSPPEGILMGITRQTVFELAAEHGLPMREASLTAYDLYAADEVFLTSTAGGIMPLVEIDGRSIGSGKPGPIFQKVHDLYWALRESGRDSTPVLHE